MNNGAKQSSIGAIAEAGASIFGNITKLITTSPRRIGKSTVRGIHNDLWTDNKDLLPFLTSLNSNDRSDFNYQSNITTAPDHTMTIILIAVLALAIFFIIKNVK